MSKNADEDKQPLVDSIEDENDIDDSSEANGRDDNTTEENGGDVAVTKASNGSMLLDPTQKQQPEYEKRPTIIDMDAGGNGIAKQALGEGLGLTWSGIEVKVNTEKTSKGNRLTSYFQKNKKYTNSRGPRTILKDVFGVAESGQLLAIMGGSGAGKTTLLNVLTKRNLGKLSIQGNVRVNGQTVSSSVMRSISAYVQQDDLFIGTMKVREHLHFQAMLRLGSKVKDEERQRRVEDVITELGLGKCANTLIGVQGRIRGISGGERKRLAFASEALTDPALLFCDEPTSGLDSFMAQQIVSVLKQMASKNKTIICTIHQPSSPVFAMFDQLCLMAEGKVAYLGPAKQAAKLFESVGWACPENFNPADHYIRTLAIVPSKEKDCRKRVRKICDAYERSEIGNRTRNKATSDFIEDDSLGSDDSTTRIKKSPYKATWIQQFNALFWRSMLGNLREPLLIQVRLQQTIVVALILGLVYLNTEISGKTIMNVNGVLFLFVTNMTFQFVFGVINVFCDELPIFLREHLSGIYRVDTYFWSKNLAELPQYIVLPIIFTVILYWMAGLYADAATFFILCGINALTANVAISLGYAVSCVCGDVNIALSVAPIVVIPFMLFGGFYLNTDSVPVYFVWLQYLSYFKYSFEAVAINEWSHVPAISGCENNTCPATGDQVLDQLSFPKSRFALDLVVLAVMVVAIRFIAFFALLGRSYAKK